MQSKAQNDDIADEQDMAAAVLNAAKKTIISKVRACTAFTPTLLHTPITSRSNILVKHTHMTLGISVENKTRIYHL